MIKDTRILRRLGYLILLLVVFGCNFQKDRKIIHEKDYPIMDNLKVVPDWLKLNVDEVFSNDTLNVWVPTNNFQTSSLIRVPRFPRKFSEQEIEANNALKAFEIQNIDKDRVLKLKGIRNEQISAQIAIGAKEDITNLRADIKNLKNGNGDVINKDCIQIRYVKYVPVQRARSEYVWSPKLEDIIGEGVSGNMSPNVVGDPLIKAESVNVPSYRAQPIWVTIKVPKTTPPGKYEGTLFVSSDNFKEVSYSIALEVEDQVLPDPIDYKFNLDMWINPSAISGYYKLENWSEKHWAMIEVYLKEYASRGGKNITATITHQPWRKPWIKNVTIFLM